MGNCILCSDSTPAEGELIWRGDDCRVVLIPDADLPGFCRVIWNRHASEMSDLSHGERDHLMTLVFAVEEAMRYVMKPDKINLASLGNLVPHLHWHVIPRFRDDAFFPGSVWSAKTQQTPESVLAGRQKAALKLPDAIREQISQLY